jgi:hypothetical protein
MCCITNVLLKIKRKRATENEEKLKNGLTKRAKKNLTFFGDVDRLLFGELWSILK